MKPYFSLLLPTRDRIEQLPYALSSLMAQSFKGFEVIIGDSDPTPVTGTGYFSRLWEHLDERFTYLRTGDVSMTENWNACLAAATGEYVYVMQDKAVLPPHALGRLHALTQELLGDVVVFNQQGHPPFPGWTQPGLPVLMLGTSTSDPEVMSINPREILQLCVTGGWWKIFWFSPRSINSIAKLELVKQNGYGLPDPDITSAFMQLDLADSVLRLDEVLVSFGAHPDISSGLKFKTSLPNAVGHINHLLRDCPSVFSELPLGYAPIFHNLLFADFKYAKGRAQKNLKNFNVTADDYWKLIAGDFEEMRSNNIDCTSLERSVARVKSSFRGEFI